MNEWNSEVSSKTDWYSEQLLELRFLLLFFIVSIILLWDFSVVAELIDVIVKTQFYDQGTVAPKHRKWAMYVEEKTFCKGFQDKDIKWGSAAYNLIKITDVHLWAYTH